MFTGLIQKIGRVVSVSVGAEDGRIVVQAEEPWDWPLSVGESISVSGACLTLVSSKDDRLVFDALQETFRRTNLGQKRAGDRVNIERALRAGDALGGHIVTGHVDGVGITRAIRRAGRDWVLEIEVGPGLLDGLVTKGSVACDGASLTIADLKGKTFRVHIIPHTWEHTALSDLKAGGAVNIETDILGKYVKRLLPGGGGSHVTLESLRRAGFMD